MTQPPEWVAPGSEGGSEHTSTGPPPPPPGPGHPGYPPAYQGNPYAAQPNPYAQQTPYAQVPGAYPPGTPYAPAGPPRQTGQPSGLSITAFILGLVGCVPPASIVAIVIGIVALVRKQALRGLAIAGIVLGLLWTAGGIAFFATGAASRLADGVASTVEDLGVPSEGEFDSRLTAELVVGDCFDDPWVSATFSDADRQVTRIDCARPHHLEVYAVLDAAADLGFDGEEYPTDAELFFAADEACIEEFEGFIGLDYDDSLLVAIPYYPSQESWTLGNRTVTCAVTEFEPTSGSLEGANR